METLKIEWPFWLDDIWAKSPDNGKDNLGESLAKHTFNVLKKLAELASIRPQLPEIVKFKSIWKCLFWACLLHDFGKATKSFQIVLRGGGKWPHRHEVYSVVFLDWIAENFEKEELRLFDRLNSFEKWILNPKKFDYKNFDTKWLLEIEKYYYILKRLSDITAIKEKVDITLNKQYNPKLAEIKYRYFNK